MLSGYNARGLAAMYTKRFRITVAQWRVLTVIGRHSPASATTVANHTSLEPDKVTRAVDSLVRLGMVNRRSDRRDRRFVVLTLSANGKRVNHEIQMVRNAMELELTRFTIAAKNSRHPHVGRRRRREIFTVLPRQFDKERAHSNYARAGREQTKAA
jgi:DNA-binding MarR family transcriptional regulator